VTRRRTRTALIAATAATALLLTACGGSDNGDASDDIPGVDETTQEPGGPEDEPEEEEPTDDGRPVIDFGADYENIHEIPESSDPAETAAILDVQGFNDAVDEAIATFDFERPALRHYIAGRALTATLSLFDTVREDGLSSIGSSRYFNYSVTMLDEEAATFSFCRDYSAVVTIDFDSREVVEEAETDALPTLFAGRIELNSEGTWQTVEFDPFEEASECR
jgi:hypothetical protein